MTTFDFSKSAQEIVQEWQKMGALILMENPQFFAQISDDERMILLCAFLQEENPPSERMVEMRGILREHSPYLFTYEKFFRSDATKKCTPAALDMWCAALECWTTTIEPVVPEDQTKIDRRAILWSLLPMPQHWEDRYLQSPSWAVRSHAAQNPFLSEAAAVRLIQTEPLSTKHQESAICGAAKKKTEAVQSALWDRLMAEKRDTQATMYLWRGLFCDGQQSYAEKVPLAKWLKAAVRICRDSTFWGLLLGNKDRVAAVFDRLWEANSAVGWRMSLMQVCPSSVSIAQWREAAAAMLKLQRIGIDERTCEVAGDNAWGFVLINHPHMRAPENEDLVRQILPREWFTTMMEATNGNNVYIGIPCAHYIGITTLRRWGVLSEAVKEVVCDAYIAYTRTLMSCCDRRVRSGEAGLEIYKTISDALSLNVKTVELADIYRECLQHWHSHKVSRYTRKLIEEQIARRGVVL